MRCPGQLIGLLFTLRWTLESVRRAAVRDADDLGRRAEWDIPRTMQ